MDRPRDVRALLGLVGFALVLVVGTRACASDALTDSASAFVPPAMAAPSPLSGSAVPDPVRSPSTHNSDTVRPTYKQGDLIATVDIPRLDIYGMPLLQGVADPQINKAFGHYPETALPDQNGNFAFAGHRSSRVGFEPLADVDRLRRHDVIIVRYNNKVYTYELARTALVSPNDVWVIQNDAYPAPQVLTLTTCHPRYGSTSRWIWWGVLVTVTAS